MLSRNSPGRPKSFLSLEGKTERSEGFGVGLNRDFARLAGANAHDLLDAGDKNLAVANFAGTRRLDDGLDGPLDLVFLDDGFDLDLGQEIHHIFGAAIQLGMPLLTAKTLDFGHCQAGDANLRQGLAYLVEFERLDDGGDEFHVRAPRCD